MPKRYDLVGQRFGKLLILRMLPKTSSGGSLEWECRCDCGVVCVKKTTSFKNWGTKSCGCLKHETTPGLTHGMSYTREYLSWKAMKQRCLDPNNSNYQHYGGRGIKVCARWMNSFENFYADMGPRPPRASIDRIDVNGNYEPSNCRWATRVEQMNNTRTNRLITFNGKTLTMSQWAMTLGMSSSLIYVRLKKGWTIARALSQPIQIQTKRKRMATVASRGDD